MPARSEQTEAAIVAAARGLFHANGYGATPLGKVAGKAGLEKGHLTYYFPGKTDLLAATAAAWEEEFRARIARWDPPGTPPAEAVGGFIAMVEAEAPQLARQGCPIGTLTGELGKASAADQQRVGRVFGLLLDWLEEKFVTWHPRARARAHAEQLLAMAQGAAVLGHASRDAGLIRRQAKVMRDWLAATAAPASARHGR